MCGIAGIIGTEKILMAHAIKKMTDALQHRGPDGWGFATLNPGEDCKQPATDLPEQKSGQVWLGHRRLSIIDLDGSKQPLRNENGNVWVIFNGEIYNYGKLRKELTKKGHLLREAGDTEVLVHLWEEYGTAMLEHITGMFALAVYDTTQNMLFLARDRFGQKPLYYWQNSKFLAFASELQSLWPLEGFPGSKLNEFSIARYFRYCYIPGPDTIYRGVNSLKPGHFLTIHNGNLREKKYWQPEVRGRYNHCSLMDLQKLLDNAVESRLRSDVPLGAFLSGGIDSAMIVASMARQMTSPVETFTITTGESWCDESKPARITSNYLKTSHHEFTVKPDFVAISKKLARHFGQPFADYSCVPTYYVSRETRKHVKVALSGDGGDELFAGYMRYANYRFSKLAGMIPWQIRQKVSSIILKYGNLIDIPVGSIRDFIISAGNVQFKGENHSASFHRYWSEHCFQPEFKKLIKLAKESDIDRFSKFYKEALSDNPLEKWLEVDQKMYLADDILTKVDISSMAVSLECRSPFLDHRLAEEANKIPIQKKLHNKRTKIPLRELAANRVPNVITNLPKKGFTLPLAVWLRSELKDWAYEVLFSNISLWAAFLRPDSIWLLWREHQSGRQDHSMRLWMIIAWVMWMELGSEASLCATNQ